MYQLLNKQARLYTMDTFADETFWDDMSVDSMWKISVKKIYSC